LCEFLDLPEKAAKRGSGWIEQIVLSYCRREKNDFG
jgi:hypothetical protein